MALRRDQRLNLVLAVLAPAALLAAALLGGGGDVLLALPPLLCLVPLLLGRYPGEDGLRRLALAVRVRVRVRRRRRRRAPAVLVGGRPRRASVLVARGGRLIATCLAVRPPPARAVVPA